ncbi:hypothetical protein FHL15_011367 [Xylaria flabelliformis]|uniref:Uncharacterized protein n=1 Tax=Xylaria flabelliformis TaxID=2512241 RepID=A0A553HIG0_9PEZI|nr:hypothetical protein FHL15_011367 [Xylaria flabelliformis]
MEPIAVVGAGCRFPGGANTLSKLWDLIRQPYDLATTPPTSRFDVNAFYHVDGAHHGTTNATKSYFLSRDIGLFDAAFFNIQAAEAEAMDPQQRLLLEVVYDALCNAGQRLEALRGSDTAVYVGIMCDDYNTLLRRDWETLPRYTATGLCRAIHANRLSYFFDWHGASVTLDTACSSGMVAVDQAVQILRSGKSQMAVAAGSNLILTPDMYISESKLGMLSPSGHCRMWDASADGYARGEGVACVVLKTLSRALADNDPIECLIRETGVNQDGRTLGLTMPSATAQTALIRACYQRAGLDPMNKPQDRPQFFHAHGTGTQAGDPQEASALSSALFTEAPPDTRGQSSDNEDNKIRKLLVGSIKTVIGHTEGTAGIASIIGTMLALKNRVIPPNLHFHNLNPQVEPFYRNLQIPTEASEWTVGSGEVRRASVNSFGFGGTNAHCIMEEYVPPYDLNGLSSTLSPALQFTPLVFSAASATALRETLSLHLDYLKSHPNVRLADLAYTLQQRRSIFPYRRAIIATTTQNAIQTIERLIDSNSHSNDDKTNDNDTDLITRFTTRASQRKSSLLGIFTGQGAQWPRMGAVLMEASPFVQSRVGELDRALQSLPNCSDRPAWTIRDQLLASKEDSRVAEAALSQPLCAAVQIVLVDILRVAGLSFTAVVGHSSGEIGAAYAAGLISAQDAIRIAYFRGMYARLASSPHHSKEDVNASFTTTVNPSSPQRRGAMMAVGATFGDAQALCSSHQFIGRVIQVAAVNSDSSVTLSGDEDAIEDAEQLLRAQGKFARRLHVDTAYHSAFMDICSKPYLASLEGCGIREAQLSPEKTQTIWFSSVSKGEIMTGNRLTNQYWIDNMRHPVLFAGALSHAIQEAGPFDLAVEVGPHAALRGPVLATMNMLRPDNNLPYTGLLSRNQNDVAQISAALGYIWTHLGTESIQLSAVELLLQGGNAEAGTGHHDKNVLTDLPVYPFDHQHRYWTTSRLANHYKYRRAPNPLLGTACFEAATSDEFQWRNLLRPQEIPWLKGHMLQGQIVFPATGYVCMAIEAMKTIALETNANRSDAGISLFELTDIELSRAITFSDNEEDSSGIEIIFIVSSVSVSKDRITSKWACYTAAADEPRKTVLNAKGRASGRLSPARPDTLMSTKMGEKKKGDYSMVSVQPENFYNNLSRIGYGYSLPFRGISSIQRRTGYSVGELVDQSESTWENSLVLHPGLLDSALQTLFAAWLFPGDPRLWGLYVPVSFSAITINPYYFTGSKHHTVSYETFIRSEDPSRVVGDVYLLQNSAGEGIGPNAMVQLEGAALVPFSPATPINDLPIFSRFQYGVAVPDGVLAAAGESLSDSEVQMFRDVDRISYWYARNTSAEFPPTERHELLPHFQYYLRWCDRMVDMVTRNQHPKVPAKCNADTRLVVEELLLRYNGRDDFRFVQAVGNNLVPVIRAGTSMLEHMNKDGLLRAFYAEDAICCGPTGRWLSGLISQIAHRFPALKTIEVGAGTGATTSLVLRALSDAYNSYTFTDISPAFFLAAEERFANQAGRMTFKTLDMEKPLSPQGYVKETYDVLVAVNVLHVSANLEATMGNLRRLLKPGGFLVVGELTSTDLIFAGVTVGTLPGWWIGADTDRPWGPVLSLPQWDALLRKTGFCGIDTVTPDIDASLPCSVFVSQVMDDRVTLLRNPLSVKVHPRGLRTDAVGIVGGTSWPVYQLSRQVFDILGERFRKKELFETVQDFACSEMARSASDDTCGNDGNTTLSKLGPVTVLCLADLDTPFLQNLTTSNFTALKTLLTSASTLVWVTRGSRAENPWGYMMTGLLNTAKTELPGLYVQVFDLDNIDCGIQPGTASSLAETLLRQLALRSWATMDATGATIYGIENDKTNQQMLWTSEPQVFIEKGRQVIPRLVPDPDRNARYNSLRRNVFAKADPFSEPLELVGTGQGSGRMLELRKVSPLRGVLLPSPRPQLAKSISTKTIVVTYSLLQSVALRGAGFLRLCIGTDVNTNETMLVLTHSSDNSFIVPSQWCVLLPKSTQHLGTTNNHEELLISVAAQLVARHILSFVPAGTTLLVNEPDRSVQSAIQSQASTQGINLVFTSSEPSNQNGSGTTFVCPGLPRHAYQSLVPASTAVYIHFSRGSASDIIDMAISNFLPTSCVMLSEDVVLNHVVKPLYTFDQVDGMNTTTRATEISGRIAKELEITAAAVLATGTDAGPNQAASECIALANAPLHKATGEPLAVIDWTASTSFMAKIQPIDAGIKFRPDRTYFFAGMAGELGQCLTHWMIAHGARHVVLASRTPKVNSEFVSDMAKRYDAIVKVISIDITSRESVRSVQSQLMKRLPPIAGIVNGALVLDDSLLTNMTLEQFGRVTAPKVLGTQLLDELFGYDNSLDFFIVCSSIASIIGWPGQSNYAAANDFMTALVSKRRKRGMAGSTMNIPAVLGIGYAAHSDVFDFDSFEALGYINISDRDLQILFAEAILTGHPRHGLAKVAGPCQTQVAMGINYIPHDLEVEQTNRRDIKLSHFFRYKNQAEVGTGAVSQTSSVRVRAQIEKAGTNRDALYRIVCDGFLIYLKRILRIIDGEQDLTDVNTLAEKGVDSLVAVDVRAWFQNELDVDVPTLKILSSVSIADLLNETVDKMKEQASLTKQRDISLVLVTGQRSTSTTLHEVDHNKVIYPTKTSCSSYTELSPRISTPSFIDTPANDPQSADESLDLCILDNVESCTPPSQGAGGS